MPKVPDLVSPAVDQQGRFSRAWVQFFSGFGTAPTPVQFVTVGASPFSYTASDEGHVRIMGGTVSAVSFIRGGFAMPTGQTAGFFPMSAGDILVITYTVAPLVHFIPS